MQLTFLGTSGGVPTRDRNVSALAVRHDGDWDLFDCGESTQHQLLLTTLSLPRLRRVFLTHLHGDHCFGIFGVLCSRAVAGGVTPLTLFGPPGTADMIRSVLNASAADLSYELEIIDLPSGGGRVIEDDSGTIDAVPLDHPVPCFAYWHREATRPGSFDVDAATALGVSPGPEFGALNRGEAVTTEDGRVVRPAEVIGPPRTGRSYVIAGDNRDPAALLAFTGPLDLLVHEATFTEDVIAKLDDDRGHSTAAQVGRACESSGVRAVILTHFSARYGPEGAAAPSLSEVRSEARAQYSGNLHLARDLVTWAFDADGELTERGRDR